MAGHPSVDAVVVGSGPNGLTAAVVLATAGLRVRVVEAEPTVGGGARTEELTLPGFRHDICSAVHPLGAMSPVFRALALERDGLEWLRSELALAHPMPDGPAATLQPSLAATAAGLGRDGLAYRLLVGGAVRHWEDLAAEALGPPLHLPRHPLTLAGFGARGALPASALLAGFREERTRTLLAGLAAHAIAPLRTPFTAAIAVGFATAAPARGWPVASGGSAAITAALATRLGSLGGEIVTGAPVRSLAELPRARAYLLDLSAPRAAAVARDRLPARELRLLGARRRGPAVFKLDYALSAPVPWRDPACARATTVHLGGSAAEIAAALDDATHGRAPLVPFLIVAQAGAADPSRAPAGAHTLWVYGHVPNAWDGDLTGAVERQIERFAPGFRDVVLQRVATTPAMLEARNANEVGGDIGAGAFTALGGVLRPYPKLSPYATGDPAVYLCSAATPPGAGVHGMSGYHAARTALRRVFGRRVDLVRDAGGVRMEVSG